MGKKKYYRDQEFLNQFGKRLREIRLQKGISQEKLSLASGFPPSQIGTTERGEINTSLSHIAAYARALGIHPKELFEIEFKLDPQ